MMGVSAQQHKIDTLKSTLTIHVGKTGVFSGLGHEHEVSAPIHNGAADIGSHPAVEIHVNASELRVIGKDDAIITKAAAPILGTGALGGLIIGWIAGRFGH